MSVQRFWIGGLAFTYEANFDLDATMWPPFYRDFDQPQPLPDGHELAWHVHWPEVAHPDRQGHPS